VELVHVKLGVSSDGVDLSTKDIEVQPRDHDGIISGGS
jgi:hypothetical protein